MDDMHVINYYYYIVAILIDHVKIVAIHDTTCNCIWLRRSIHNITDFT